jgi:hypothetical protein
MNLFKKGPDLKLSGIKVPDALRDLYYDLDDRHLLPVVVVLLIAIIAVPLLLAGSSESEEVAPEASPIVSAPQASIEVAKAAPRLRDYKRRLGHLDARNPFVAPGSESGGEIEVEPGESSEEVVPSPEEGSPETIVPETGGSEPPSEPSSEPSSESNPNHESSSPTTPGSGKITYFSYAIDVRVVPVSVDGKPSHEKPTIRRSLPALVMLPSRDTPALTYVATSKDHEKAVMLVSSDVTALFGDAKCVVGSESCQLLALEEGVPETVVYGPGEKTFRIELRKIELVNTDSLNISPLGEPEKGKKSVKESGDGSRALGRLIPAGS